MDKTTGGTLTPETRRVFRIGHRGAAGHAPENTIAAIQKGISLNADLVELDVRRTRDGCLVVIHDEQVDRTTDGSGLVSALTCEQLRRLDAGDGQGVPRLEAALSAASGLTGLMLEVKAPGIAAEVCNLVQGSGYSGPVIYASFLHEEMLAIREIDPLARTMVLVDDDAPSEAAFAQDVKAQMVGLDHKLASEDLVAMLHEAGLDVWMFTVNERIAIRRAIDLGADGIISDYPEMIPKIRS